jgi:hypothetical protein
MSEPNTTVMYAGKMTQSPLQHDQQGIIEGARKIVCDLLHDTVKEEHGEPVVVFNTCKVGKVLVKI